MIVEAGKRPPHIHSLVTLRELVGSALDWNPGPDWLARASDWVATTRYPTAGRIWPAPTSEIAQDAQVEALQLEAEVKRRLGA